LRKKFPRNGRLQRPAFAWNCSAPVRKALTSGLSGIMDGAADASKIAGVFALQERMMAVRLAGRKLVAFHPDRDLKCSPERFGFSPTLQIISSHQPILA
jgi:hypothetical protein